MAAFVDVGGLGAWSGRSIGIAVAVVLPLLSARVASAQGFAAWVALYGEEQLGWLENENRLEELCADVAPVDRCRDERLRPMVRALSLRSAPDSTARTVGELIVTAVPGRGLAVAYRAAGAYTTVAFTPDLYLQDWGYGPLFHQTVASRRGDWVELPPDPWPGPVWIHAPGADRRGLVLSVQEGDILDWRGSGWTVVGAMPDALMLRPEQPADMWCGEGDPPPSSPVEAVRVTRSELLDARGHLTIGIRYPKGC